LLDYLGEFAASFGVTDMHFPTHTPNTRRVLALAEYAREQGQLDVFRDMAMDAYWQTGDNLEDPHVLQTLASRAGLAPDAALRAMDDLSYLKRIDAIRQEASAKGVTGIPTFFIGQEQVVGCQPYETLAQAAERAGVQRRT
jgi:predicted DsbA family dithiol-disulfide isomerase